jgi:hypothetical protein
LFILLTLISSTIFFNTSLGIGLVGGALLVVSGVILINWKRDDTSESSQDLRGTLILIGMMLATAIFWVVGLLTTVEGLKNTEPIIARIIRNGIRVIIYLVIAIVYPRMGYKKAVSVSLAKTLAGGLFFTLASFIVRVCSRQHLSDRRSCTNEYFSAVGGNARADIPQRKDGTSVRDGHDPLCRRNHHSGSNQVTDAKSRRSQCS